MLKLTVESTSWVPNGRTYEVEKYADGRVLFGSFREARGKVRSPPKLRWFDSAKAHESFVEVRAAGARSYLMRVSAGDFDVFLNGRKVDAGKETGLRDGDLVRIANQRFILGDVPTYPRDDVEAGFLAAIREHPRDDEPRLVYADWLEEREDFAHAAMLRLELQIRAMREDDRGLENLTKRFRTAAQDVSSRQWRVLVARPLIERCEVKFELVCPKQWENLTPTARADVRHCDACEQDVVLCTSTSQAFEIARNGGCVALEPGVDRSEGDLDPEPVMMVGSIAVP